MDDADFAQERTGLELSRTLAMMGIPRGRSAFFCMDCDERIPEARRLAYPGVQRCIECQEDVERLGR